MTTKAHAILCSRVLILLLCASASALVWNYDRREKKKLRETAALEIRFLDAMQKTRTGIVEIDASERIIFANEYAKELFGYPDLVGQQLALLIPDSFYSKHREHSTDRINEMAKSGRARVRAVQCSAVTSSGVEVPVLNRIFILPDRHAFAIINRMEDTK